MFQSSATLPWAALATTLLVEAGGLSLWRGLTRRVPAAAPAAVLLVNLITHPIFWRLQDNFAPGGLPALYAAEGGVVLIEAAAYHRLLSLPLSRALALSFLLNLLSLSAGFWLWS